MIVGNDAFFFSFNKRAAMKRTIVLIGLLLFTLYATSDAQTQFGIGLRTGLNFGTMSFTPDPAQGQQGVTQGGRTGFMIGAGAELAFGGMFAVEMDLMYVMKGASFTQGPYNETIKLSELDIPILFKVKFLKGMIRPYGFVGPDIGLLLSATDHIEGPGVTRDNDLKSNPNGVELGGLDFALEFGGGAELMITKNIGVSLDVRYSLGLSNLASLGSAVAQQQGATQPSWKASGFQIQVGGMWHLH
jgi:hypothetical protein